MLDNDSEIKILEEDNIFKITPPDSLKKIIPCLEHGETKCNGEIKTESFIYTPGDIIEFVPLRYPGELTWKLEVRYQGIYIVAKVRKSPAGRYCLPGKVQGQITFDLSNWLRWEELPPIGEVWDFEHLKADLQALKVLYGLREEAWKEILEVVETGEVLIAQATLPIPPEAPRIEDYVGIPMQDLKDEDRVDFFASKLKIVPQGAILARKVPGKPGIPGRDVFGRILPEPPYRELSFKLKKNVHLSPDGLEVISSCPGLPVRSDEVTYMVENIYVQQKDLDLSTGSIEFPGDVFVGGNVQDGLHIFASGKVEILGAVSRAEIKCEKGLKIHRNVLASKITVGVKYVVRTELLSRINDLHQSLEQCLLQAEALLKSSGAQHLKPGQCLKLVLEKNFPDLPRKAAEAEKFVLNVVDELVTQELTVSIRTAKHFLAGLGPLDNQSVPFLSKANLVFSKMIENMSLEIPEKLECIIDYVQGSIVNSGGLFKCTKGIYNSTIQANADVIIEGVCRGGKIIAGGNVKIKELGGSGVSTTTVQFPGSKRLKVDFCHPNVVIIVDKQVIRVEEAYKQMEVYKENGLVQIEKLLVNSRIY